MDIITIIINFQTPDLLDIAVNSFKEYYPDVPLLIVDNGSKDESPKIIDGLVAKHPSTKAIFLDKNIYHGPAMDHILKNYVDSEFVFFLDSDTETHTKGFLEKMNKIAKTDDVYGVGQTISVNDRGFKDENGIEVILTPYLFLKVKYYFQLPPFIHHGQPTINNFKETHKKGLILKEFPISDYIHHDWRGTANRYGYGLGIKGKFDYILNKLGL
jgi:GT2 family glycosyltransferase